MENVHLCVIPAKAGIQWLKALGDPCLRRDDGQEAIFDTLSRERESGNFRRTMLLPCPHCRKQFKVRRDQLPSARARLKCPACEGVFVLNLASTPVPEETGTPMDSRPRGNRKMENDHLSVIPAKAGIQWLQALRDPCLRRDDGDDLHSTGEPRHSRFRGDDGDDLRSTGEPRDSLRGLPPQAVGGGGNDVREVRESDAPTSASADAWTSPGIESAAARHTLDRGRPRFLLFWTLVPACCLLLALSGILLSGPWTNTRAPELSASQTDAGRQASLSSSVASYPEVSRQREGPVRKSGAEIATPGRQAENSIAQAFWTSPSDRKAPCDVLRKSQAGLLEAEDQDTCRIYPLWITYLILETSPMPDCALEPTFSLAADALQKETLCGPGHAFLCAYYLKKRLLDRSQSFLDQALRQAPDDPWVKLVEAVFYEQAYYDDQRAIGILADLSRQRPSFSLAGYTLGKSYIREEEYGEANAAFESLKEDAQGQIAFWRIRRALSSLEQTADQCEEKAEAILALSRAFTALKDYPMAQDLYRWVLEEMPDSLPKAERTAACCELGGIYEKRGDNSSAYDSYRNALEIDPEFPAARAGIQDLLPDQADRS